MGVLQQSLQIITLQRSPRDIDYSPAMALFAAFATTISSFVQTQLLGLENGFTYATLQTLCQAGVIYLLLKLNLKSNRFIQTITAIFAVTAILQFSGLVLNMQPLLQPLAALLTIWTFYLTIIILKQALECHLLHAIFLTLCYFFIIGMLLFALFPDLFQQIQAIANEQTQ